MLDSPHTIQYNHIKMVSSGLQATGLTSILQSVCVPPFKPTNAVLHFSTSFQIPYLTMKECVFVLDQSPMSRHSDLLKSLAIRYCCFICTVSPLLLLKNCSYLSVTVAFCLLWYNWLSGPFILCWSSTYSNLFSMDHLSCQEHRDPGKCIHSTMGYYI